MSRIRDLGNLFSASTAASTDAEVTAAIASHNNATTSVHGITDTAGLATQAYVQANKGIKTGDSSSRPTSPTEGDVYSNTQTGFLEVYSALYGWEQVGGIVSQVTNVVAANSGTGRAYNNGAASISFTPGVILGRSYTITSSPGSYTATGSFSPITITGLQSSTQYTYTVVATNNYGTAAASSPSSPVTATTVPQAPTIGTATAGNQNASIAFTPGATGGSAITAYTVTSTPGNITGTGTTSPIVVSGLTVGTSYTFTITATNANGTSLASSASNSVTPTNLPAVTGGTLSSDSTYYYRKFTSNGDLVVSNANLTADLLIVAGGGGGSTGGVASGGGGAGGLLTFTSQIMSPNTYTVTVGGGGATSTQGGNSSVTGLTTCIGGGAGTQGAGGSGGSGGGAGNGSGTGGARTLGQGNIGGTSHSQVYGGGGGGGAGAAGQNGTTGGNSFGGAGIGGDTSTLIGAMASVTSSGVLSSGSYYFAGGGGGGFGSSGAPAYPNGGLGGGGSAGGGAAPQQNGYVGTANTGGGGGAGSTYPSTGSGASGGSGIVIMRYLKSAVGG